MNYTKLTYTPLYVQELERMYTRKSKRRSFDGVFFSLGMLTMVTLGTVIYALLEKGL